MPDRTLTVIIDGEPFETVLDQHGVQRFPANGLIKYLFNHRLLDLKALALACAEGKFSKKEYMQLTRDLGMSVCDYLDAFPDLKVQYREK